MKIATWNIGGCHKFHGTVQDGNTFENTADVGYFSGQLKNIKPDFAALQEALTPQDNNRITQTELIARDLSYKSYNNHPCTIRVSHIEYDSYLSLGNITNLEVLNTYFHAIPNPNLKKLRPNGDTWLTLDYGFLISEAKYQNTKIILANTLLLPLHYFDKNFADDEFKNIRDDITKLLLNLKNKPCIVLGDFNFGDLRKILPEVFQNGQYKEVFENTETAPGKGQQDHILYSSHWTLTDYALKKLEADHYLCEAEFNLKG